MNNFGEFERDEIPSYRGKNELMDGVERVIKDSFSPSCIRVSCRELAKNPVYGKDGKGPYCSDECKMIDSGRY
tara:strand:- start:210 stop:428 length:219 start_codon:yes stop_codon:yes gene_type:complete